MRLGSCRETPSSIAQWFLRNLSFLACQAGARRVYAIEAGASLEFARLLAARNGFQDRLEFVDKPSTQVILPERVDVIVGDIHDTFGLQPRGLASFVDARERFLKPGGTLIPCGIQLIVVPVEEPDRYGDTRLTSGTGRFTASICRP